MSAPTVVYRPHYLSPQKRKVLAFLIESGDPFPTCGEITAYMGWKNDGSALACLNGMLVTETVSYRWAGKRKAFFLTEHARKPFEMADA